jgi:hypothetical protein
MKSFGQPMKVDLTQKRVHAESMMADGENPVYHKLVFGGLQPLPIVKKLTIDIWIIVTIMYFATVIYINAD